MQTYNKNKSHTKIAKMTLNITHLKSNNASYITIKYIKYTNSDVMKQNINIITNLA